MPPGIVSRRQRTRMDARAGALHQGWLLPKSQTKPDSRHRQPTTTPSHGEGMDARGRATQEQLPDGWAGALHQGWLLPKSKTKPNPKHRQPTTTHAHG